MLTLIVSDNQSTAVKLRQTLEQHGHECPLRNIVSINAAFDSIQARQSEPDVIVFVLAPATERWGQALRSLRDYQRPRIIVVGPKDPNLILLAVHAGADDYLDETGNLLEELISSLNRVAAAGSRNATSGQVVTVIAASGGSGRTTIATNLAVLFAKQHGACGLLDLDLWGGASASLLNLKPKHTIADLCRNIDKLDQNMFEQSLLRHESGVRLLPVPQAFDDIAHVTPEGICSVLRLARKVFTRVIADVNEFGHVAYQQLLQQSTTVLLVSRLDFAALRNARQALNFLEHIGVDRRRMRLVANRHGQPQELSATDAETALNVKISDYLPDDPKAVNHAINCGNPCVIEAPKSKFTIALAALVKSLEGTTEANAPATAAAAPAGGNAVPGRLLSWFTGEPRAVAAGIPQ